MEITMPGATSLESRITELEASLREQHRNQEDLLDQLREAEKSLAVLREIKEIIQRQQNG